MVAMESIKNYLLQSLVEKGISRGLDKLITFYQDRAFFNRVDEYFSRYKKEKYEYLTIDQEFDFTTLTERLKGELFAEVVLAYTALHSNERDAYRNRVIGSSYLYAKADSRVKKKVVFEFLEPFFMMVKDHLQSSDKYEHSVQIISATEDIIGRLAEMLYELKTDITSLTQSFATQINYHNSFAEFIDLIAPKRPNSQKFHYLNPQIRFYGREKEMNDLEEFLADEKPISFCVVSGAGGTGKSRFVYEFVQSNKFDIDWKMVYLSTDNIKKLFNFTHWNYPRNLLLIIDYAGGNAEVVGRWLKCLSEVTSSARAPKTRLILIERQGAYFDQYQRECLPRWFHELRGTGEQQIAINELFHRIENVQFSIEMAPLNDASIRNILRDYSTNFEHSLTNQDISKIMKASSNYGSAREPGLRVLYFLLITDAFIHGVDLNKWDINALIRSVVDRYKTSWRDTLCKGNEELYQALFQLIIFSTASSPWFPGETLPEPFTSSCNTLNALEATFLFSILNCVNNVDEYSCQLNPIEPDIIGEFLFLDYLQEHQHFCKEFLVTLRSNPDSFLAFLKKCIEDYGDREHFRALFKNDRGWMHHYALDQIDNPYYELAYVLLPKCTDNESEILLNEIKASLGNFNTNTLGYVYYARCLEQRFYLYREQEEKHDKLEKLLNELDTLYQNSNTHKENAELYAVAVEIAELYASAVYGELYRIVESGLLEESQSHFEKLNELYLDFPKSEKISNIIWEAEEIFSFQPADEVNIDPSCDDFVVPDWNFAASKYLNDDLGLSTHDLYLRKIDIVKECLREYDYSMAQQHGPLDHYADHHVYNFNYDEVLVFDDETDVHFLIIDDYPYMLGARDIYKEYFAFDEFDVIDESINDDDFI